MAVAKIVVHYLGDWVRDEYDTSATCSGAYVAEYSRVEDITDPVTRRQVEWMIEHGEVVTQCGRFTYQVTYAQ